MAGSSRKGRSLGTGRQSRLGNHDQLGGAKSGFDHLTVLAETAGQVPYKQMACKTRQGLAILMRQSLLATMDQEKTAGGDE